MTCDALTARDETFALINAALAGFEETVDVRWQGKMRSSDQPAEPSADGCWAAISMTHNHGENGSIGAPDPAAPRRWSRAGVLSVQCFAPLKRGSVAKALRMALRVQRALQGNSTAGGVWFRRCATEEVGEDRAWYNVNMTASFDYDEER